MEMKNYIEMGEKKAGKQVELAKILEIRDSTLRLVKTGHSKLPDYICYRLATYLDIEAGTVIAASNLVTEKDEKKRKVFEDYLKKSGENALKMIVGGLVISMLTLAPQSPSVAASHGGFDKNIHYTKFNARAAGTETKEEMRYVRSKNRIRICSERDKNIHSEQRLEKWGELFEAYLTRLRYSRVRVSISILSPISQNNGTASSKPVGIFAGFSTLPVVSPLTAGSV